MPIVNRKLRADHLNQNPTCQLTHLLGCCKGLIGVVHHIEMGPNRHDADWNLITLCAAAHRQIHHGPKLAGQIMCWTVLAQQGRFDPVAIRNHTGRCPLGRVENGLADLDANILTMAKQLLEKK